MLSVLTIARIGCSAPMQMPSQLASDLLATAMYGGNSLLLVQASGGNNSVKSSADDLIWIKASGRRLAEVSTKQGIASLRLSALKELVVQDCAKSKPHNAQARRIFHEAAGKRIQTASLNPGNGGATKQVLKFGLRAFEFSISLIANRIYSKCLVPLCRMTWSMEEEKSIVLPYAD